MAELIDLLFLLWACLGVVVYVCAQIYEQQQRDQLKKRAKRQAPNSTNLDDLSTWRSGATGAQSCSAFEQAASQYSRESDARQSRNQAVENYHYDYLQHNQQQQQQHRYQQQLTSQQEQLPQVSAGRNERSSLRGTQPFEQGYGAVAQHIAPIYASLTPESGHQPGGPDWGQIPTATGFNAECVEWVNSILYLFYTQAQKYAPIVAENVYRSLNEKLSNLTNSSGEYSHLVIEFTAINRDISARPELTNVRTELESDKSISVSCKLYCQRLVFELSVQQLYGRSGLNSELQADFFGHNRAQLYELTLEKLEGKLKSMAVLSDKLLVLQFMEKPDTKIQLRRLAVVQQAAEQASLLSDDALVELILQALEQVVVDLYFGDDVDFPHFASAQLASSKSGLRGRLSSMLRLPGAAELKRQLKQDFLGTFGASHEQQPAPGRRVFVKILQASNIDYNQNASCLLELDEPEQQAVSSTRPGDSNPRWDEHFLFELNDKTRELSVELWDGLATSGQMQQVSEQVAKKGSGSASLSRDAKRTQLTKGAKFLGRAQVAISLDELRRKPVQRLCVALQPLTAHDLSASVGGELSLELLYLDNQLAGQGSASPSPSPSGELPRSSSANSLGGQLAAYSPGDLVSINRKLTPSGYVITTTTITKAPVARKPAERTAPSQLEPTASGSSLDGLAGRADTPAAVSSAAGDARSEGLAESVATRSTGGRLSRSRSRSLLRAIKKRFSFSRTRSRSLGPGADTGDDLLAGSQPGSATPTSTGNPPEANDYFGMPQRQQLLDDGRARSVPTTRDPSELPTIVINRGRLSASALTFTHPKSQLVIEVREPTLEREAGGAGKQRLVTKHYAVAENSSNKRKWSRRGLKLHLFNEHQFVACHLAGSSTCHLCGRVFSRRPGKQGYKCRNCHLLSHKQCHVRVDHNCPYAAGNELALEYIDAEPPAELANELAKSDEQRQVAQQRPTAHQTLAKSISLDVGDR